MLVVTAVAYRHARRPYLAWWALYWAAFIGFYAVQIQVTLVDRPQRDGFALLGLAGTTASWLRVLCLWGAARSMAGRPVSRRAVPCLLAASLLWLGALQVLGGYPVVAPLTRIGLGFIFLAGAVVLLTARPRSAAMHVAGLAVLGMAVQGFTSSWLVTDFAGNIVSSWVHSALSLTLGLAVLGRLLEEEREAARAQSHELTRANARLAELDQLKSDFVSMVSHELRTPLGLIKGYAGTLLEQGESFDAETRREFLQVIDEETDRLSDLVSNLLDMSRIERGTLRVDRQPVALAPLLEEGIERLRVREPSRPLQLDLTPALPLVFADARRIAQVVDNLLVNAANYSAADAPIVLAARAVNGHVEVAVADQGVGIAADDQPRVFERFFRGSSGNGRAGTGLGLAICKSLVEAHDGHIRLESAVGEGSTFIFSLPVWQERT